MKGSKEAIRRSLRDGVLGDASNIRASRNKSGPFELLRGFPEFRDLIVTAAPLQMPGSAAPAPRLVDSNVPLPRSVGRDSAQGPPSTVTMKAAPSDPVHIAMNEGAKSSSNETPNNEWIKWLCLALLAFASAAIAFWCFPPQWFK